MDLSVFSLLVVLLCLSLDLVRSELILVHAIFRHGEKSAENAIMLPNNPYKNQTFYPYGPGQLTNEGKKTLYNFGKIFRKRYDQFLGDIYLPEFVDPWASSFPRCQASLETVLTAVFPPKGPLIWNEHLEWQPIPYQALLRKYDDMFMGFKLKKYEKEYYQYSFFGGGKKITEAAKPILSYVQNHTNSTTNSLRDIYFLYLVLASEEDYGLPLPEWTKEIYPHPIDDLVILEYQLQMGTRSLRRQTIGRLMKKILEDTENRIKNTTNCKLHLYCGHEINLMQVLKFLDIMYHHRPGFAACLSLELHKENGGYFLEAHYKDDKHSNFQLMRFPTGEKRLYLHQFRHMVEDLFEGVESEEAKFNVASRSITRQATYLHSLIIVIYYWM